MRRTPFLIIALSLTAGCGRPPANQASAAGNETVPVRAANAAAPAGNASAAASPDRVLHSETVSGTFTGWEMGDYLWAHVAVEGRSTISAQPGPTPIDLFLDAHQGEPVTAEIATVRTNVPEAGGDTEIERITAVRSGTQTAAAWWQALSPADRLAAQRHFEEGALSSGAH
jgi:hypothetical protein